MKNKSLHLLPWLLVFLSGCLSNKGNMPAPVNLPEGVFTGHFKVIHHRNHGIDSASATLTLTMETATGYKVTGDTATVHAGSYGSYTVYSNPTEILFADKTFPATGTPTKVHLSGLYLFAYDGTTLQIAYNSYADTLQFYYNLRKTGN